MEISPLTRKDLKSVSGLVRHVSKGLEFADAKVLETQAFGDPDSDSSYLLKVSQKNQIVAAAMGVARSVAGQKTGFVKYAGVLPKFRNRGLGQSLFSELERRFQKREAREVRVGACPPPFLQGGVEVSDTASVCFLMKRGYERCGEIVDMCAPLARWAPQARDKDASLIKAYAIRKAKPSDEKALMEMIQAQFPAWAWEARAGLERGSVFIAEEKGAVLSFCCADATNPGFLGPMGTLERARGLGLARLLLIKTVQAMKKSGYASIRIPWVGPIPLYAKVAGAKLGPNYWQFSKKGMIQPYLGKTPRFAAHVRVHDSAVVIGDVELGEGVSVWPSSVLRGDYNSIKVGKGSNIQDGAVIHNDTGHPCSIGEDCVIGHLACVHGATLGNRCLIGIHAIVLNGAVVGDECIIGAGSLVTEGGVIPPRSLVLGSPGRVIRSITDDELQRITRGAANYRGYAERQLPLAAGLPGGA